MSRKQNVPAGAADGSGNLLALALLALIAGAAAGFVGGVFRLALEKADRLRDTLIAWAHGQHLAGFLIAVVAGAAATLVAAWLVRRYSPYARSFRKVVAASSRWDNRRKNRRTKRRPGAKSQSRVP
jgi:H+/Cl- antiporter ClcA